MATLGHLASRFLGSLLPVGPKASDTVWAIEHLTPGEQAVWARMSPADRRHAAGVARRASTALGPGATRAVVAAALLHDAGKIESGLGTFARVGATLAAAVVGRQVATSWSGRPGMAGRVGLYLRHPDLGAELLRAAGSDDLTVAWAAEHHLPEARWSVPVTVGRVLKAADDD